MRARVKRPRPFEWMRQLLPGGRAGRLARATWSSFGRFVLRGAATALGTALTAWLIWWLQGS